MPKSSDLQLSGLAVGYVRRSTDKQETSIPEQEKAVQEYAAEKGYKIIRWYKDDAISGDDTENRHAFQQMLVDAKERHDFQVIICWDQSRFGRFSPQEAGYWTYQFSKANVGLVTVDKGLIDWNDFTEWLTYSVNQHSKHDFLKQLSKDVVRGQLEAVTNGSWLGSAPYGYRIEGTKKNKRLVVDDPTKVKVVQRIFREYVQENRSLGEIAQRLQIEGYATPGGAKKWNHHCVRGILSNPAYAGDLVSAKYTYGKFNSIVKGQKAKPGSRIKNTEATWTVKKDTHEHIVERETFDQAQVILAKGKTGRSKHTPETNPFLLTGLLKCGKCGGPLWGDKRYGVLSYECGNWQYNGAGYCEGTKVKESDILTGVADHLDTNIFSLDFPKVGKLAAGGNLTAADLPEAFARVKALVAPPTPKTPAVNRKAMEAQVKKLDAAITKAQTNLAHVEPENIGPVQEEIRRMKGERSELEAGLKKKPPTEADLNGQALEVLNSLWWLRHLFWSAVQEATHTTPADWTELAEEIRAEYPDASPAFLTGAASSPLLKRYLRSIVKVVCHSQKTGQKQGTRHKFLRGEIVFRVGGNVGESNPRLQVENLSS